MICRMKVCKFAIILRSSWELRACVYKSRLGLHFWTDRRDVCTMYVYIRSSVNMYFHLGRSVSSYLTRCNCCAFDDSATRYQRLSGTGGWRDEERERVCIYKISGAQAITVRRRNCNERRVGMDRTELSSERTIRTRSPKFSRDTTSFDTIGHLSPS